MTKHGTPPEDKRRGFTDRRARRLVDNATVLIMIAVLPTLGLVCYRITAGQLGGHGGYGWTVAAIISILVGTAMACIFAAMRVQVAADRADAAREAAAAAFAANPAVVVPGPDPGPAPAPTRPAPTVPTGAGFAYPPPDQRPVILPPGVDLPAPPAAPAAVPAAPEGPEPEPQPAPVPH